MRRTLRRAFLISSAVMLTLHPMRSMAQVAPPVTPLPATRPSTTQASFNFENAPISSVVNYLSDSFGFTVISDVPLTGRVPLFVTRQNMTADQALVALNSVLKTNGYAAVRQGKIIKITSVDKAKKEGIPVKYGSDPDLIDDSDELITQIMPVHSVDAVRLRQDLAPLIGSDADVTSNGGSNSIMITDTSARIKRLAKIVNDLDKRDATENGILVKQLKFADSQQAAKLILDIFKPQDATQQAGAAQNPFAAFFRGGAGGGGGRGGGGGGFGGGGFGGGGRGGGGGGGGAGAGAAASGSSDSAHGQIEASSDQRTNTVVVTGPHDILDTIDGVLKQLDTDPAQEETFFLYRVKNGQAADMQATLNALFTGNPNSVTTNRNSTNSSTGNRVASGFGGNGLGGGGGGGRGGLGGGLGGGGGGGFGGGLGGGGGGRGGLGGGGGGFGGGGFGGGGGGFGGGGLGGGRGGIGGGAFGGGGTGAAPSGIAALIGQVLVVADTDTNSLLVATASQYKKQVQDVIDQLDRPVPQVLIKALVAEVTHDNGDQFGVDFSVLNERQTSNNLTLTSTTAVTAPINTNTSVQGGVTVTNKTGGTTFTDTSTATANTNGSNLASNLGTAAAAAATPSGLVYMLLEKNVTATIQALETAGKLDVLSRPYILTSDNQEATIVVGEEDPFVSDTRVETTGQLVNTIQYQQIGVILDVTPHINPEGLVVMDVNPQVSQKEPGGVVITAGVVSPIFSTRTASARVAIRDGETIVIGGMMQDETTQQINKIPLLGDIPILGALFQNNSTTKQKTELLFFLTPHVALEPSKLQPMTNQEMHGLKLAPAAVEPGTFQEHLRGMERGNLSTQPSGLYIPPIPTTRPTSAPGEPSLPNGQN